MHTLKTSFDSHHIPSGVSVDTVGVEFETILSEAVNELSTGFIVLAERMQSDYRRTDLVEWNRYSLSVHRQRIFLWSGKLHTWRLLVPELWLDVLQKIKALGMNVISIYAHRGLNLQQMAMQVGPWDVLRPRPYINSETTAGAVPQWVTSTETSHPLTNGTSYLNAWEPYVVKVAETFSPLQITCRRPIIAVRMENEHINQGDVGFPGKLEMTVQLKEALLLGSIDVPLTINDAYMGKNCMAAPHGGIFPALAYIPPMTTALRYHKTGTSIPPDMPSSKGKVYFFAARLCSTKRLDQEQYYSGVLSCVQKNSSFQLKIAYGNSTNNKNIVSEADDYHLFPEGSVGRQKKTF
ncbi:hypothetical protein FRB97_008329 [Tulasnella sp. 331]|nr:hypothetical protein FRB97_008329 [Tulasnella sp. 331]